MSSKTNICNMALGNIGIGKQIADIDTERTVEAEACRQFYDIARDAVLGDFQWPFSTKIVTLGLVGTDINGEWAYSYRYPADCMKAVRILSGVRNETRQTRVPYRIIADNSGSLILTDFPNAQLEYVFKNTQVDKYPPDFILSLALKLAGLIVPRVSGGDRFKIMPQLLQLYEYSISSAQATAANEESLDEKPQSEFITQRDGPTAPNDNPWSR